MCWYCDTYVLLLAWHLQWYDCVDLSCRHALTALTRVMPKDGRKHQSRFVGYYVDHGESVDAAVELLRGKSEVTQVRDG